MDQDVERDIRYLGCFVQVQLHGHRNYLITLVYVSYSVHIVVG